MRAVAADDGGLIFLAIVERDPDLARIGDDVIVGEDMPFFVDDEARALALLRHQSVEKVEGHNTRSDVDDGSNVLVVDADVVLFFGVEPFAAVGFRHLHVLRTADPVGGMETSVAIGSEVEESGRQNNRKNKRTQESHRGYSPKACSLNSSEKV